MPDGQADVPVYDIAHDGRCGWQTLDLDDHRLFVAEGIFAQDVVPACRRAGLLAEAYCVRQHALVTFWRRLTRDLRERRKPPLVLVRRGWALLRDQRHVVQHAVDQGCRPVTPEVAYREISRLEREAAEARSRPGRPPPSGGRFGSPTSAPAAPPCSWWRGCSPPALRRRTRPLPPFGRPCSPCTVGSPRRRTPAVGSSSPGRGRSVRRRGRSRTSSGRRPGRPRPAAAAPGASEGGVRQDPRRDRRATAGAAVRRQPLAAAPRRAGPGRGRDDVLRIYEPACGRLVDVTREAFLSATLDLGGWRKPWFSVLPRGRRTPA